MPQAGAGRRFSLMPVRDNGRYLFTETPGSARLSPAALSFRQLIALQDDAFLDRLERMSFIHSRSSRSARGLTSPARSDEMLFHQRVKCLLFVPSGSDHFFAPSSLTSPQPPSPKSSAREGSRGHSVLFFFLSLSLQCP